MTDATYNCGDPDCRLSDTLDPTASTWVAPIDTDAVRWIVEALTAATPPEGAPGVECGTCDLCRQPMLRTATDCWHPASVARACPPEPPGDSEWLAWALAGNRPGRPGREHFVAAHTSLPGDP